jgi:hypothetical protein
MKKAYKINAVIWTISILVFYVMKFNDIFGRGTVLSVGFIIALVISTNAFVKLQTRQTNDYLLWILSLLTPTFLFSFIQNRMYIEILIGTIIITLVVLTILLAKKYLTAPKKIN